MSTCKQFLIAKIWSLAGGGSELNKSLPGSSDTLLAFSATNHVCLTLALRTMSSDLWRRSPFCLAFKASQRQLVEEALSLMKWRMSLWEGCRTGASWQMRLSRLSIHLSNFLVALAASRCHGKQSMSKRAWSMTAIAIAILSSWLFASS